MKIYIVSEAINLQGDFCGSGLEALGVYSKAFASKEDAQKEIATLVLQALYDEYNGNDDIDQSGIYMDILNAKSNHSTLDGRDYDFYEWENTNRACKWTLTEQEI